MDTLPLVSIVIPVYNGERYLGEAIESVLAQTYRPVEVIVIDDGSTDSGADIARSYKEVRYIYQTNQGNGMARNVGIAAARGDFIAFLDHDDLWAPNKLSVQVDYLRRHPHVGYVIARMRNFLEPGTPWPTWIRKDLLLTDYTGFLLCTLVARKTVFEQIGDLNTSYRHSNDSDWFFRANDAGIPMAILPEVLLYRRIHGSNLSYDTQTMMSERMRVLKASIDRKRNRSPAKE